MKQQNLDTHASKILKDSRQNAINLAHKRNPHNSQSSQEQPNKQDLQDIACSKSSNHNSFFEDRFKIQSGKTILAFFDLHEFVRVVTKGIQSDLKRSTVNRRAIVSRRFKNTRSISTAAEPPSLITPVQSNRIVHCNACQLQPPQRWENQRPVFTDG